MKRTRTVAIQPDIDRGFVISKGSSFERHDAFWKWCSENKRIFIEVRIKGRSATCDIDVYTLPHGHLSDSQLNDLETLAIKHNLRRKGSKFRSLYSTLKFTTDDALAFAADVVEWSKTVNIEDQK